PPWFNEGLAEYYQTFTIEQDQKVKLGLPQSNHLLLLQQNKLIPLETLFKINNYSLGQNANHSRSIFYAESWALIHYLVQGGKSEGLGKFLTLSLKETAPEKVFQDAFQMTYQEMEKELKKYVAQNSYKYTNVTFKNKMVFDSEMAVTPLSEADTNAYLGDLLYHTNRADDAEKYLQKSVALKADSSMANTTFGMVKLRQRKYDDAKKYFEKAISDDQKNHLAFYNYAYLLSREDRDEFGFVNAFEPEKAVKMRELLKKAIAVNPNYTESYELFAFVSLVNNEQLDEGLAYLQKALKYQPGSQRYLLRIAEIYSRQQKYAPAQSIADKIAKTADDAETKSRAENLLTTLKQMQEIAKQNEESRKQYENAIAEARKNNNNQQPVLVRRKVDEKPLSPEELKKAQALSEVRGINQAIRKPEGDEKQIVGRIQKVECKADSMIYTVKSGAETFQLSSKDFVSLTLTSYVTDLGDANLNCNANIARVNTVLTYKSKPNAPKTIRGELIAVDFVPSNFELMTAADEPEIIETTTDTTTETGETATNGQNPDFAAQRRTAMMQAIKAAMRKVQDGEKRELGTLEKIECKGKETFFLFKTTTKTFKLLAASPQSLQFRGFTPEIEGMQFGCNFKQIDVPVVFTFKESPNPKNKVDGEIVSLEFMPKGFVLEK
ncbi:MAG: tetratricopeptide repeat protein, partial [Pyrinomonadaceae bacterium]|nr:tetratricopeptide repeat protein [Pyrinomonadaceae bacterium]